MSCDNSLGLVRSAFQALVLDTSFLIDFQPCMNLPTSAISNAVSARIHCPQLLPGIVNDDIHGFAITLI